MTAKDERRITMYKLATEALKPGMVLYDDLYNSTKVLVFKANTSLTKNDIDSLSEQNFTEVTLCEPDEINMPHYEYIHKSTNFKRFNDTYTLNLNSFHKIMRNLDTGLELNINKLLSLRDEIIGTVMDGEQLLDYLYNMMPDENEITYNHCFNCGLMCYVFGSWLGFDSEDLDNLTISGFMFDIGKTQIPENILWKPEKLTPDEFAFMQKHVNMGYELIKARKLPPHVVSTMIMHHERCDGSGYPAGITEDKIDPFALIAAIADTYEAMTHPRAQRLALTPFQAIRVFEEQGIEKYGQNAKLILTKIANMYVNRRVLLNRTLQGAIIEINEDCLSRPTLLSNGKRVDLRITPKIEITRML
jgi:HD-GYP domain-containing protein (c-di-GMP phosphodiesterase class II)